MAYDARGQYMGHARQHSNGPPGPPQHQRQQSQRSQSAHVPPPVAYQNQQYAGYNPGQPVVPNGPIQGYRPTSGYGPPPPQHQRSQSNQSGYHPIPRPTSTAPPQQPIARSPSANPAYHQRPVSQQGYYPPPQIQQRPLSQHGYSQQQKQQQPPQRPPSTAPGQIYVPQFPTQHQPPPQSYQNHTGHPPRPRSTAPPAAQYPPGPPPLPNTTTWFGTPQPPPLSVSRSRQGSFTGQAPVYPQQQYNPPPQQQRYNQPPPQQSYNQTPPPPPPPAKSYNQPPAAQNYNQPPPNHYNIPPQPQQQSFAPPPGAQIQRAPTMQRPLPRPRPESMPVQARGFAPAPSTLGLSGPQPPEGPGFAAHGRPSPPTQGMSRQPSMRAPLPVPGGHQQQPSSSGSFGSMGSMNRSANGSFSATPSGAFPRGPPAGPTGPISTFDPNLLVRGRSETVPSRTGVMSPTSGRPLPTPRTPSPVKPVASTSSAVMRSPVKAVVPTSRWNGSSSPSVEGSANTVISSSSSMVSVTRSNSVKSAVALISTREDSTGSVVSTTAGTGSTKFVPMWKRAMALPPSSSSSSAHIRSPSISPERPPTAGSVKDLGFGQHSPAMTAPSSSGVPQRSAREWQTAQGLPAAVASGIPPARRALPSSPPGTAGASSAFGSMQRSMTLDEGGGQSAMAMQRSNTIAARPLPSSVGRALPTPKQLSNMAPPQTTRLDRQIEPSASSPSARPHIQSAQFNRQIEASQSQPSALQREITSPPTRRQIEPRRSEDSDNSDDETLVTSDYVRPQQPSPQYGIRDLPRSRGPAVVGASWVPPALPRPPMVLDDNEPQQQQPPRRAPLPREPGGLPQPPSGSTISQPHSSSNDVQSMTLRMAAMGSSAPASPTAPSTATFGKPQPPPQRRQPPPVWSGDASSSTSSALVRGDLPTASSSSSSRGFPQSSFGRGLIDLSDAPPVSLRRSPSPARQQQQQQPQSQPQPQQYQPQPQASRQRAFPAAVATNIPAHVHIPKIESPAPLGGRDKRADIPKISFPGDDSGDESDGWGAGPSINVSGPAPPSINVNGPPSINVKGPPSINVNGPPSINVGPLEFSVSGGDDHTHHQHPPAKKVLPPLYRGGGLICAGCGGAIVGRIVNATGVRWHPGCFRCTECNELLEHVSSYEHEGRPYCHLDYHEHFAPRCYTCKTAIIDERFITLEDDELGKRTYHEQHFFCAECGDPFLAPSVGGARSGAGEINISGDGEFEEDDVGFTVYKGHPYCEACHVRLRLPKCKRCKRSIRDGTNAVEALGGKWCWECFICDGCEKPFDDPSFFQRDDRPYCENCFQIILRNDL